MSSALQERIQSDLKGALKEKRSDELSVLRGISSELKNAQLEKSDFTDEDAVGVLSKLVKQRKQSAAEYREAGREDLAEKEEYEIGIIARYLPEEMSEAEIDEVIKEVIAEQGEEADFGNVMKNTMAKVKGKADGNTVREKVKEHVTSA